MSESYQKHDYERVNSLGKYCDLREQVKEKLVSYKANYNKF